MFIRLLLSPFSFPLSSFLFFFFPSDFYAFYGSAKRSTVPGLLSDEYLTLKSYPTFGISDALRNPESFISCLALKTLERVATRRGLD